MKSPSGLLFVDLDRDRYRIRHDVENRGEPDQLVQLFCKGVQHKLIRIRSLISAEQYPRFVGIEHERFPAARILLPRAVETLARRAVVSARYPSILRAKLEGRQVRVLLNGLDHSTHSIHIDAVDDCADGCLRHDDSSLLGFN